MLYGSALRSSTSCSRSGILSMVRLISRTLHGSGLRNSTSPSLPIITNMNPRGRSCTRKSLRAAGSVSVRMITSLSASSSDRAESSSICWLNRGSLGLSAKTTTGRANQIKSSIFTEVASKAVDLLLSHMTGADDMTVSCATAVLAAKPQEIKAKIRNIVLPFLSDIGEETRKAKSNSLLIRNKFGMTLSSARSVHSDLNWLRDEFVLLIAGHTRLIRSVIRYSSGLASTRNAS
jgi:hypothetical protein